MRPVKANVDAPAKRTRRVIVSFLASFLQNAFCLPFGRWQVTRKRTVAGSESSNLTIVPNGAALALEIAVGRRPTRIRLFFSRARTMLTTLPSPTPGPGVGL